ncbi:MAG: cobyrinic acid a,c-diamide synthase [Rhodospirillaceae bacterium]|nr:cobyrinic acid a,c-diamide synthase [Magnetovibrio sp.]MAY67654.1 cobyrinic acid a,c-diamide synthase [Rhodospirillaceae bacterium]
MPPGVVIAAPSSGSGKTLLTLGLLRHFRDAGVAVASAKVGPDYIDPAFHRAAGGRPCPNLDLWAMREGTLASVLADSARGADLIVCEGVMGLFDGARLDEGSTADAARTFGWPVILVVDAAAQGASASALVGGFARHRPDVTVAGVVFNRTGSARHADILKAAMAQDHPDIPVLGCLPRLSGLTLPERHLGLVQAGEHGDLEAFLNAAAQAVAAHVDTPALRTLARATGRAGATDAAPIPPLGQKIAVARDRAFSFCYPHVLDGWRHAGAEISFFSPLEDEIPAADADAVYLPGGYPELHAGRLAGNACFLAGLRAAAAAGRTMFGECGGYMVLGDRLTDADGVSHAMAGLLPVATSFAERKLHLGYRRAVIAETGPLGPAGSALRGHEFHYATILTEGLDNGQDAPLFHVSNADGAYLGALGRRRGNVLGSFVHLIDREDNGA